MLKAGCGYIYSIHRTIKRLSKAHLTFLINYVDLRDGVMKDVELL